VICQTQALKGLATHVKLLHRQ